MVWIANALALDAIRRVPRLADLIQRVEKDYWSVMERHKLYISDHGEDLPEIRNWSWASQAAC